MIVPHVKDLIICIIKIQDTVHKDVHLEDMHLRIGLASILLLILSIYRMGYPKLQEYVHVVMILVVGVNQLLIIVYNVKMHFI